ncbi:MAG: molybdopterin biosynthesis protein [Desulfovibrionaceae bacterium]
MPKRNVYLSTVPPAEAVAALKARLDRTALVRPETIPSHEAAGRVTAEAVFARASSPTFHAAAMDGIAVYSEATFAAREDRPVLLDPGAGFVPVNTGNPLPAGKDAVVMIEHVHFEPDGRAAIEAPAFPYQHVRRVGEDIVATELLIPRNRRLTPYDVGALLAAGVYELQVWERVRLAFLPTGDEVLDFRDRPEPGPGQVIESNSQVFAALARSWGVEPVCRPPVRDDLEAISAAIRAALAEGCHGVVVGAGSSAGSRDYTRAAFEAVGEVLVHGISVMPGKPTLAGVSREGRLLVGAPGYPVSAVVCLEDVLAPVAAWLGRRSAPARPRVPVVLARKVPSRPGMEELVRLAVGEVDGRNIAAPLARGAGVITSLTRAQAVTRLPANSEGLEAGAEVMAELLGDEADLARVLVHVGSHDNLLDLLADALMGPEDGGAEPYHLVSSHVGSMGGLAAIARGAALFAGSHLFDPETGDFNFPFLDKALGGVPVTLVNLAIRHQGLIVAPGNPKGVAGPEDLGRPEVRFVNRQRGAGTRILLDHHLEVAGVNPRAVTGYDREEHTHMAVAVAVSSGTADCGLGILAAAKALGLDFVPLARERYDLVIPNAHLEDPRILALLAVVRSPAFQARVRELGGYETPLTGQVMRPGLGLGEG